MSAQNDKEPEEVPEGMVRRTRKVRKKRKGKKSAEEGKAQANSLFAKAKDLLVGMEEENEEYGPVDLAEQVRRLKQKKEDDRPLDDIWGTKRRSSSWLWIVLVGMIVSVIAIVIGVTKWLSDDSRQELGSLDLGASVGGQGEQFDLSEGPLGWFHEDSVGVLAEAQDIIARANAASDSAGFAEFVRESPNRGQDELSPELWGSDCLTNATSYFTWLPQVVNSSQGSGNYKRGYLKITGTRVDGNRYEMYFVEIDNKITLDWDATMGWSEMSVAEIAREKPRKEIFLRCQVTKKNTFDQKFGKIKHSGYVISGGLSDEFFLAYVPINTERGKVIDRDLRLLLNYGSFVTDQPPFKNMKATLRVRYNNEVGKEGIFEIVEFLHDGWVSP